MKKVKCHLVYHPISHPRTSSQETVQLIISQSQQISSPFVCLFVCLFVFGLVKLIEKRLVEFRICLMSKLPKGLWGYTKPKPGDEITDFEGTVRLG